MAALLNHSVIQNKLMMISSYYLMAYINKQFVNWELELFTTKWFDYRHLSSLQATISYMRAYEQAYMRFYAEHINYEVADYIKLINIKKMAKNLALPKLDRTLNLEPTKIEIRNEKHRANARRNFSAYWRGRQIADALGMPYEVYVELVMTKRLRLWNGRKARLPRPIHLYRDIEVEYAQNEWEEIQASKLYVGEHPAYFNHHFQNLPHQNAHHEWLFKQTELRSDPSCFLARFVHEGRLPLEKVENRLIGKSYRLRKFRENLCQFQVTSS